VTEQPVRICFGKLSVNGFLKLFQDMKLKYWCGLWAKNAPEPAPMLGFHLFMLGNFLPRDLCLQKPGTTP
jgi:hypothetical protein